MTLCGFVESTLWYCWHWCFFCFNMQLLPPSKINGVLLPPHFALWSHHSNSFSVLKWCFSLGCVHLHTRTHSDLFKMRTILSPLYFRPSLANWILWAQLVLSGWFAVDCVSISSPVKTSAPSITGKQVSSCILTAVPLSSWFLPLLLCTMYFIVISDLHVNQLIAADTIVQLYNTIARLKQWHWAVADSVSY